MKKIKSSTKRHLTTALLAFIAIANVFTIGFSSFITIGSNSAEIGNIQVEVGGLADCKVSPSQKATTDEMSSGGFKDAAHPGQYLNKGNFYAYYNIEMYTSSPVKLFFYYQELGQHAGEYNISQYISNIKITLDMGQRKPEVTHAITGQTGDFAQSAFTFGTSGQDFNYTNFSALKGVTVAYEVNYTGHDFASDIFMPLVDNLLPIQLGVKGNE